MVAIFFKSGLTDKPALGFIVAAALPILYVDKIRTISISRINYLCLVPKYNPLLFSITFIPLPVVAIFFKSALTDKPALLFIVAAALPILYVDKIKTISISRINYL